MNTSRVTTAAEINASVARCREEMRRAEAAELAAAVKLVVSTRYCAGCGEREGSSYAKRCCTDPDNMIED